MAIKTNRPKPGSYEFTQICFGDDPKPLWHLKQCMRCAKRKADNEHYWKWRVKTRDTAPCESAVCRECGWPMDAHKKSVAQKK
ncbi:MAG: hypothetical protein A2848_00115 [Candidatus Magasanikbacteria bacterium RIFCSPHIGHO2_01_FULL_50_8]|uniref:Uncharacterized protein n=2 Tax=Candidatus Magasanikiibacteriota TaxID=1752731 RepID=A0A1F6LSI6_9BACT|nr:MAG: hypothetical protein A2848_00115 [Candidatus Magasanikbacteria bacterium RIFCSPHIGHO2_01_FULL_50_8]OGH67903.1 MAG: hypothetical protein A3C15_01735 [Candidatus Magasanikbacteria bacterium RIFCSPHIGHO2_02_FULL_50_9b]